MGCRQDGILNDQQSQIARRRSGPLASEPNTTTLSGTIMHSLLTDALV